MMFTILNFIIWFGVFLMVSVVFIYTKTYNLKMITLVIMFLAFFGAAIHERLEYFNPIEGVPSAEIDFVYNFHKIHYVDGELYVLLWITDVDNSVELVYNFPYKDNENFKDELDRLKRDIANKRKGAGPYHYGGKPSENDGIEMDYDIILQSDTQINIRKEPE